MPRKTQWAGLWFRWPALADGLVFTVYYAPAACVSHLTAGPSPHAATRPGHQPPHRAAGRARAGGDPARAPGAATALLAAAAGRGRGQPAVHLQPHRAGGGARTRTDSTGALDWFRTACAGAAAAGRSVPGHLSRPAGGAAHVPPGRRPGLAGGRRAADPGPAEGVLRSCPPRGRRRQVAGPRLPAGVCGRQAHPHRHGDWRQSGVGGVCGGDAGAADFRRSCPALGADHRRRGHGGTDPAPPARPGREANHHRQPHARPRPAAGRALRRAGGAADRRAVGAGAGRHRAVVHQQRAADPGQGHGGERAQGPASQADVPGRSGRAARHRGRGVRPARRVPVHRGRPARRGAGRPAVAPGGGRRGRAHRRQPGRRFHGMVQRPAGGAAGAGPARRHAAHARSGNRARAGRSAPWPPAGAGDPAPGARPDQQTRPRPVGADSPRRRAGRRRPAGRRPPPAGL